MSTLQDLAATHGALKSSADLGSLVAKLCSLDEPAWDRLVQLRAQLNEGTALEDDVALAAVLPPAPWNLVATLRNMLKFTSDPAAREEMQKIVVDTLTRLAEDKDAIETSPIDDPLPFDDPEVDRQIEEDGRRFHRRYFELKARAGLSTIQEVARKAGISPTTVQAIESHAVRPQFRTVRKIAEAFGVPVTELWPERR